MKIAEKHDQPSTLARRMIAMENEHRIVRSVTAAVESILNVSVIGSRMVAIAGAVRQNCGFPGSPPMSSEGSEREGEEMGGEEAVGGGGAGPTGE